MLIKATKDIPAGTSLLKFKKNGCFEILGRIILNV
jgi:hypothetical protein